LSALAGATAPARADATSTLATASDIFFKGSVDGKHIFMVLGMDPAQNDVKSIWKWAIKEKDLVDLKNDAWNQAHSRDVVARVRAGASFDKRHAPEILSLPWKTLQEVPGAFRTDMQHSQSSYYSTKNPLAAAAKAGGWAAWAVIQGGVYLVIETPLEFAYEAFVTAAAVPFEVALEGLVLSWDAGKIAFKYVGAAIATVATESYAFATSSIATAFAFAAAGGVAIAHAGEFLFYELPLSIFYPVQAQLDMGQAYTEQQRVANAVAKYFDGYKGSDGKTYKVASKIGDFRSTITLSAPDSKGNERDVALVKVTIKKQEVFAKIEVKRSYFKDVLAEAKSRSRKEVKADLHSELLAQLAAIKATL
jgi:hypothetical protein